MDNYKFPLLMKSTATGLIILAEGITSGSGRNTRVRGIVKGTGNGCSSHKMGIYSDGWCLEIFKPFEG